MNILLTGVTGYIGGRLLPVLLEEGHFIYACVRDKTRFPSGYENYSNFKIVEVDFINPDFNTLPTEIDVAFYLIHSMTTSITDFDEKEVLQAENFVRYMNKTSVKQVIYLSGIISEINLSKHLASRKKVGEILFSPTYSLTILRAAIIVGSGSSSFEIMYDLVDKLPFMIAPKSLQSECQPIAVRNVVYYLKEIMLNEKCFNETFDIGGPDIITYKNMLYEIALLRGLKRKIVLIPWISPKLCAHWFYFITSVSYKLAVNLSESMNNRVVCTENRIVQIIPQDLLTFKESIEIAIDKIENDNVLTSWKDSFSSSGINYKIADRIHVPTHGVLKYSLEKKIEVSIPELIERLWSIGGQSGWYGQWLWNSRALLNLLGQGVGMRGRKNKDKLSPGDSLDFWRVIIADKEKVHLLLYGEMIMPGNGWLEFNLVKNGSDNILKMVATFRPKGLKGRIYWFSTKIFHYFIFNGMIKRLTQISD